MNTINVQFADPAVKKRTSYFFKKALVQTDIGWLFSDIQTKTDFMFSSKEFDFQIRTNENQPISQYLFYSSKDKVVVSRRYQTIAEFLGGFAGVVRFVTIFCGVLINSFLHINTLKIIINKIYAFPKIFINKKQKSTRFPIQKNMTNSLPKNVNFNLQKIEKSSQKN